MKICFILFPASPVKWSTKCDCYFDQEILTNVYNCSYQGIKDLSQVLPVPNQTEWVETKGNVIETVAEEVTGLENVTRLNLHGSHVRNITEKFMQTFLKMKQLKSLILSENNLTILPPTITKLDSLTEVEIGHNPFSCNCKMTWMIEWINGFTDENGERIVKDYKQVVCSIGPKKGKPIYLLNEQDLTDMGCLKGALTALQEVLLGVFAALLISIIVAIIIIGRRWEEVRWLMYLHLDILDKSDRDEDLTDMEYDALLSYWYVIG